MRKSLQFLLLSSAILAIMIIVFVRLFSFAPKYPIQKLSKGWTVVFRDEQYINTNLEHMNDQIIETFSKGDTITLNYEKPIVYDDLPFPYLFFKTQFSGYQVFIDNVLVNERFTDALDTDCFVGVSFNSVQLPKELSGKKLSIKLFICENGTRANLISPLIGDYDDVYRELSHSAILPSFTGIFMIVFGILFLAISLFFYLRSSGVASQVITSLLCISLGLWMITSYNCVDFSITPSAATTVQYTAMYSFLPLMYLLVFTLHKRFNNMVVMFLACSSGLFGILFVVLHFLEIVHLNQFMVPYYIMSLVATCVLILYDYMDYKAKSKSSSTVIIMIGLSVLSATLVIYLIVAISSSFVDFRQTPFLIYTIPFGCLFFVVAQLLNHFIFMTRSFAQRKEYLSLTKIAYVDNLTGVPNRASCDTKLAEADKSNDNFCILSLDLNGLKEINDNSGHPAGDKLLKSFSACLMDIFSQKGSCFRVGGDEFIVLFSKISKEDLDSMLKDLDYRLKKLDETDPEANHSVSYGYAFRSETDEKDTHSVNMLADARMYAYKREYYSHLMAR